MLCSKGVKRYLQGSHPDRLLTAGKGVDAYEIIRKIDRGEIRGDLRGLHVSPRRDDATAISDDYSASVSVRSARRPGPAFAAMLYALATMRMAD